MTTTPKTKDELLLENALLKQREAIGEDVKKLLKETLDPFANTQNSQGREIERLKQRLDGIWLKIWAVAGTMSALVGMIGYIIGKN